MTKSEIKPFSLTLTAAAVLLVLAGCGSSSSNTTTDAPNADSGSEVTGNESNGADDAGKTETSNAETESESNNSVAVGEPNGSDDLGNTDSDSNTPSTTPPAISTATLNGVVATGAPCAGGSVEAQNSSGSMSSAATVDASGNYSLQVATGAPYLVRASGCGASKNMTLFSWSDSTGNNITTNVTELTNAALQMAANSADLNAAWTDWKATKPVTAAQIETAKSDLKTNLKQMPIGGMDPTALDVDFFTQTFKADGTGIDAVMDKVDVTTTCSGNTCSVSAKSTDGATHQFTYEGTTTVGEVNHGDSGSTGTIPANSVWQVTVSGSSMGFPIPTTTQPINLNGAEVPRDEAAAKQYVEAHNVAGSSTVNTGDGSMTTTYNLSEVSYNPSINGQVGDTITTVVKGNISVSGTVQGFPINQAGPVDITTVYKRIQ